MIGCWVSDVQDESVLGLASDFYFQMNTLLPEGNIWLWNGFSSWVLHINVKLCAIKAVLKYPSCWRTLKGVSNLTSLPASLPVKLRIKPRKFPDDVFSQPHTKAMEWDFRAPSKFGVERHCRAKRPEDARNVLEARRGCTFGGGVGDAAEDSMAETELL